MPTAERQVSQPYLPNKNLQETIITAPSIKKVV